MALAVLPIFAGAMLGLITLLILVTQQSLGLPWWSTLLVAAAVWAVCSAAVQWLTMPLIWHRLMSLQAKQPQGPPVVAKGVVDPRQQPPLPPLCVLSQRSCLR